jgi:multisubunit Na+/H+ antiporter MnhG subunit
MSAQTKKPGDALIGLGAMLAVVGVIIYFMALASGGSGNPALTFALVVIGILLAILGYVKRGATNR